SRRRHTRSKRDWSSDVCSSDLGQALTVEPRKSSASLLMGHLSDEGGESLTVGVRDIEGREDSDEGSLDDVDLRGVVELADRADRSEERRVGKEGSVGRERGQRR